MIAILLLWGSLGIFGALLLAYGARESVENFLPISILMGPISLIPGIILALVTLGEDWAIHNKTK